MLAALAKNRSLLLGEGAPLLSLQLGDRVVRLALPLITEPLKEHQRQDVVLIVLPRGLAAQDVRGAPKVGFELLKGQLHALKDSIIAVTPVAQGARTYFPYLKATVDEPAPRRFGVVTVIFLTNNPFAMRQTLRRRPAMREE